MSDVRLSLKSQRNIRLQKRTARDQLSAATRRHASRIISDKVARASWFWRARTIGCYLPTDVEVDTTAIFLRAWRMKKRIFAPIITECDAMQFCEVSPNSDLFDNEFGIPEPRDGLIAAPKSLDIVITPMVAFDNDGNRIGMGGGYFDRTFSFLRNRQGFVMPKLIGVAFAVQEVENISANPWDIRVFCTVTESN